MRPVSLALTLALASFALIALIGVGLGVMAALRHDGPLDHAVSVGTYLGIAVPEFFWAIVVILVFVGRGRLGEGQEQ